MPTRTSVSFDLCHCGVREGHADFGLCSLIPLLSHSARRGRRRDASLEQANPPCGAQEGRQAVGERSLYTVALEALSGCRPPSFCSKLNKSAVGLIDRKS